MRRMWLGQEIVVAGLPTLGLTVFNSFFPTVEMRKCKI